MRDIVLKFWMINFLEFRKWIRRFLIRRFKVTINFKIKILINSYKLGSMVDRLLTKMWIFSNKQKLRVMIFNKIEISKVSKLKRFRVGDWLVIHWYQVIDWVSNLCKVYFLCKIFLSRIVSLKIWQKIKVLQIRRKKIKDY
jgi:hypothetical protein